MGDDENGGAYRKNLLDRGVDVSGLLQLDGSHTGVAAIFVESTSGENQIIVVKGASEKISEKDIQVLMLFCRRCCCCSYCSCFRSRVAIMPLAVHALLKASRYAEKTGSTISSFSFV